MQYMLDSVPWWVWLAPTPFIIGALLWFFGPFIIGFWNMLPTKVKAVIIAVATVGVAYIIGRSQGNKTARERQKQLNARAEQNRREIHDDIQKRSEPVVDRDLDKWLRDR
jgi:hypothetical protein